MAAVEAVPDRGDAGVRSIDRAFQVLQRFDVERPVWTVRDLAVATSLPKTTVVRLVATLVGLGLLVQQPDNRLVLGAGFLRWSTLATSAWKVPPEVEEVMRQLSRTTGETVNLYVRHGTSRIVVAQVESTATVRNVVPVGLPLPLWVGAAGRVLLIDCPQLIAAVAAESPSGPASSGHLASAVQAAAESGYAVSHGERELGASGIAAPVYGSDDAIVAALALGGPTPRFGAERIDGLLGSLVDAATAVSALGVTFGIPEGAR